MSKLRLREALDFFATLAMITAAGAIIWGSVKPSAPRAARRNEVTAPREPLSLAGAAIRGDNNARIAVVEYSDFQCPFCARFARDVWPQLDRRYVETGKVKVVFRHFPIEPRHPHASIAAVATNCAGEQGRFWDMHEMLFRSPHELKGDALIVTAKQLGLHSDPFQSCLASPAMLQRVREETAEGKRLGIAATPTFFIGRIAPDGRLNVTDTIVGGTIVDFTRVLDGLLASQ